MIDQAPDVGTRTNGVEDREPERFRPPPLMVAAALGAVAATSIVAPAPMAFARPNITSSSPYTSSPAGQTSALNRVSSDALVRTVRESANLTWDQLARIFGVSRRSVHNWAAGDKMSAHNLELVARLSALISALPGTTPEDRRVALFASNEVGESPVDAFRRMVAKSGHNVQGPYAAPGATLGA